MTPRARRSLAIWVAATLVLTLTVLLPIVHCPIIVGAILAGLVCLILGAASVTLLAIWALRRRIRATVNKVAQMD